MDLKERLNQVINNFQTNFDMMETEQDVKEQIEQLQSKLDVLLEENRRENRDEAIRINKGSTMSEVIQNLEVDRSNWGCARTGFIYNQKAPNRDESNELVEIGFDWRIRQNDLVAIEERRASLRESLRSLNNRILLEKGQL